MEGLGGETAPHFQTGAGGENFLSQQWLMALFPVKTVVKSIGWNISKDSSFSFTDYFMLIINDYGNCSICYHVILYKPIETEISRIKILLKKKKREGNKEIALFLTIIYLYGRDEISS